MLAVFIVLIVFVIIILSVAIKTHNSSPSDTYSDAHKIAERARREKNLPQQEQLQIKSKAVPVAVFKEPASKRYTYKKTDEKPKDAKTDRAFWNGVIREAEENRRKDEEAWERSDSFRILKKITVWFERNADPHGWDDECYLYVKLDKETGTVHYSIFEMSPDVWDEWFYSKSEGPISKKRFNECMRRLHSYKHIYSKDGVSKKPSDWCAYCSPQEDKNESISDVSAARHADRDS